MASAGAARPDRSYTVIVNPSAGGGRALDRLPAAESTLRDRGASFRVVRTTGLEDGVAAAAAAAAEGSIPVVMSGDGLIGHVGGTLAGGDTPMGIIPGGRGNDFARVLGIPSDAPAAVDVLLAGSVRRVDVGEANGRRFLCIASAGFDSEANRIANRARLVRGNLVYLYAALRALAAWRPARFTIVADGERHEAVGYAVAVANSKAYGGGMYVAPDASLEDGLFDVVITRRTGKLRFLASLPKVFKGTHVESPSVSVLRAAEVELTADRPFDLYADGEVLAQLPARLRVLPGALGVIAPP